MQSARIAFRGPHAGWGHGIRLVLLAAGMACAGTLAWGVKAGSVRAGSGRLRA